MNQIEELFKDYCENFRGMYVVQHEDDYERQAFIHGLVAGFAVLGVSTSGMIATQSGKTVDDEIAELIVDKDTLS